MKALRMNAIGGAEVLEVAEVPRPELKPHHVLVRIEAAGLNYSDIMMREGKYFEKVEPPYLMGREFSGIIEEVGSAVSGWQIGQRVVGSSHSGAMAEFLAVNPVGLFPVPDALSPEAAVAMLVQGMTALHCVDDCGRLQKGETILIHAAAGGVGTLAVQIAKQRGARVIGTASNDEKLALIRELGAEAINYKDQDWVAELKAITDGRGADVIIEMVGGDTFLKSFREALAPLGRLVVMGAVSAEVAKISNVEMVRSSKSIIGYFLPEFMRVIPNRVVASGIELVQMITAGTLTPIIGKSFALDDAIAAFDYMQNRESVGKVIINP